MKKNIVLSYVVAVLITFGLMLTPSAYGQGVNDTSINSQAPGTAGTTDDESGIDWRWMLPLLAIPAALMLWRSGKENDDAHDRGKFSGTKGGKSTREGEIEN